MCRSYILIAILFLDAREPVQAMAHLKAALGFANREGETALRSAILSEINRLRSFVKREEQAQIRHGL